MRKEMWGKLVVGLLVCSGLLCYGGFESVTQSLADQNCRKVNSSY